MQHDSKKLGNPGTQSCIAAVHVLLLDEVLDCVEPRPRFAGKLRGVHLEFLGFG